MHGAWTTAFVSGKHEYLVPVTPDRGPYGQGRARTYAWPDTVVEVAPEELPGADVDVVILQRPSELEARHPVVAAPGGRDVAAVYVEHNTPKGEVPATRHPMADRDDLRLVHVTHFNHLFWDTGGTRTTVIEHGIPEPAVHGYSGELPRIRGGGRRTRSRRWRVTGTDLLPRFAQVAPLDVYGMKVAGLPRRLGLDGDRLRVLTIRRRLHQELARRRLYLHPIRWTSLGLTLLEAIAIGVPVLALATTEVVAAVPAHAGVVHQCRHSGGGRGVAAVGAGGGPWHGCCRPRGRAVAIQRGPVPR